MRVGFVRKRAQGQWGGDLAAVRSLRAGLKELGHAVEIASASTDLTECDFILLANASHDLREDCAHLLASGIPFGVIGFHENLERQYSHCCSFVHCAMENPERLIENPEMVELFGYTPPARAVGVMDFLQKAQVCIATSPTEARWIQEDFPECRTEVLYLNPRITECASSSSFLDWTGLKKGEYVLQVGRIEMRKNQLASLLAMREEQMPLVFIATQSFNAAYEKMFFEAVVQWRRAPTWVISQTHANQERGCLRILGMPNAEMLTSEMLLSAYAHAGLHLHPAFCELPGLTYLEAAKLGIPTVASEWATIKDYFIDPATGQYTLDDRIAYALPYHIPAIREQIHLQWSKTFDPKVSHPALDRTSRDVAAALIEILEKT
ncbi:MAG: glycosyltransferase [Chlamydiota bacterium]